jgi:AraC-like DNA-binding protein
MEASGRILWVEKTEFPTGWGIREHMHDYFHLFYILSGEGVFFVNKQRYEISRGALLIIAPNMLHELQKVTCDMISTFEVKFYNFDPLILKELESLPQMMTGDDFIDMLLNYIVENGRSRLPYFMKMVNSFLNVLIGYLASSKSEIKVIQKNSQLIDTTGFPAVSVDIIMYIEQNYMDNISLEILAKHVDYNRNYICTAFKKDTGITIIDYLNYVRIRHAIEYISYSEIDISKICSRVGFSNVSHFNRTFKKFVGLSPSNYRKMYPLDINSYLSNDNQPANALQGQLKSIAETFGTFNLLKQDSFVPNMM